MVTLGHLTIGCNMDFLCMDLIYLEILVFSSHNLMGHATYSPLETGSFEDPKTLFIDFFIIIKNNMDQINCWISEQRKYS